MVQLETGSCVLHPASSLWSIAAKVMKILSPYKLFHPNNCYVCSFGSNMIVAPPVMLPLCVVQKQFLTALPFYKRFTCHSQS